MKRIVLTLLLPVISFYAWAQPSNDDCINAIELTPSAGMTCTAFEGMNVGVESEDYSSCQEINKRTVWYRFTATAKIHILKITSGTIQRPIVDVYGGDCSGLFDVRACQQPSDDPEFELNLFNLEIGEEYKISVATREDYEEGTFDICILTPPASPHDECANAIALTVNSSNIPDIQTSAETFFATQSQAGCTGTADDDVWFSFTATQSNHSVMLRNASTTFELEAFSGDCSTRTSIVCAAPTGTTRILSLSGLTASHVYRVRVYSFEAAPTTRGTFSIAITSPPVNDECANAVIITPSPNGNHACVSPVQGSTFNATQSSADCHGGNFTSNDTWFKFTATQAVHEVKVYGFGNTSHRFEVMSGTCGALTSRFCATPTFSGDTATTKVSGLTEGEMYFVRIYSGSIQGLFNICVTSPAFPSNDECASASVLTPASGAVPDFLNATTIGATNSNILNGCNSFANDVWFSFTASAMQHIITAVNQTETSSLSIELFSGSCSTLEHQRCETANDTLFAIGNLTVGNQYFIRIYNNANATGDNFRVALTSPEPVPNDECFQAITITPSSDATCDEVGGTLTGATQSQTDNCGGNALIGQVSDVWYKFEASSTSHRVRLIKGTGTLQFQVLSGTCGSLVNLGCSSTLTGVVGSGTEVRYNGLTIGNTYFVRVLNTSPDATGTFDLCVKSVVVPANNDCASPAILTPQNNMLFGTFRTGITTDATQSSQATNCNNGHDDDVWYQFTATQSNMKVVLHNGTIGTARVAVYSGDCASLSLIACQNGNSRDNYVPLTTLTVGSTYLIRVYSSSTSASAQGTFNIMVTSYDPPPNDNCGNAIELIPAAGASCTNAVAGNTIDASMDGDVFCASSGEVWFKFNATAASHRIEIESFTTSLFAGVFIGSCGSLSMLTDACAGGANGVSLTTEGLTIGNTYFIKISAGPGGFAQSNFTVCLTTPQVPPNDECANAIPLSIDSDASGESSIRYSTHAATHSFISSCAVNRTDVWFSFVAPGGPVTVELTTLHEDAVMEILTGSCSALSSVWCNGDVTTSLNNVFNGNSLTEGNTYYVRISGATTATVDFKIKVYRNAGITVNTSVASECLLENLVQNPGFENDLFIPTSFIDASDPGAEVISHWHVPTKGTSDFFNALRNVPGNAVEVPNNTCFGNQSARNGHAYGGIIAYSAASNYREYLENELSQPLTPGKKYLVSMYVSLGDFSTVAIRDIGIAFNMMPTKEVSSMVLPLTPMVTPEDGTFVTDKKNWVNVSGVITADQAYRYIVIGNFKNNAQTDTLRLTDPSGQLNGGTFPGCSGISPTAYYFIDDVVVSEMIEGVGGSCVTAKLDQTITFEPLPNVTVGDPPFDLTATASSGLSVSYESSNPLVATINGSQVTIVGAGSTIITASQPGNSEFHPAADQTQTLTVLEASQSKQDQTITFQPLPNVTVGDPPFNLTATASSGLSVSYESSNPLVATINGSQVIIVGAGSTIITASQPGNSEFHPAADQTQTLTVLEASQSKQDQTITFQPLPNVTVGDPPFNLTATASSGLSVSYESSNPLVATISGSQVTIVGAGSAIITASQPGNSEFHPAADQTQTLTVLEASQSKQDQTISFELLQDTDQSAGSILLVAQASSGLPVTFASSDSDIAVIDGNTATITGAGKVTFTASQAGDANHHPAPVVSQTICVLPDKPQITTNAVDAVTYVLESSAVTGNQWFLNDVAIPDANEHSFTATGEGVYTVQVTTGGCTSEMSEDVSILITGIEDRYSDRVIYPNPAEDEIKLSLPMGREAATIRILNNFGQPMKWINHRGGEIDIAIGNLIPGVYSVIVQREDEIRVYRFVRK